MRVGCQAFPQWQKIKYRFLLRVQLVKGLLVLEKISLEFFRMSLDPQTLEAARTLVRLQSWYRAGIIKDLKIYPSEFIENEDQS